MSYSLAGMREAINRGELRVLPLSFRYAIMQRKYPTLSWGRHQDCGVESGQTFVLLTRRSSTVSGWDQRESWRFGGRYQEAMERSAVLETPLVSVTILGLRRTKRGGTVASYRVRDDRPEFMALQGGRTMDRHHSLDPEAEMPERDWQERISDEIAARDRVLRARKRAKAKECVR